ncbi:MAG: MarR family transcriptional regulator [Devosiaceae bacterium]|nr:MarR family transcriptional regulator [Devosiaceae bacterium MH13]
MTYNLRKSVTYHLAQAAKAHRHRAASVLSHLNIYPGQDQILKALSDEDGQSMTSLATTLAVQPPTITKMVARLSAQDLVERRQSTSDARAARVFLTDKGRVLIDELDGALRTLEREALAGLDDKDRKRLRKLLRRVEANLLGEGREPSADEPDASRLAKPANAPASAPAEPRDTDAAPREAAAPAV